MGVGAILSSLLVTFAPAPTHLVYAFLLVLTLVEVGVIWLMQETVSRRLGVLASLDPRVTISLSARRMFCFLIPFAVALWMLDGFFLSLVPSVVARATGSQ
ncbi:hypothetical protein [Breoghania sp.]|uniref:hypothetical protein n=1 Tax=Breoghania sp. TaxID=2065378 RepID=UPI00263549D2|nr:hypothetical protein [Breoghania sp.]MDJ0931330.1 hypothetical protein [Breoghania sp.]